MNQKDKPADLLMVEKIAQQLSEHFDTVQIFTTKYEGSDVGTTNISTGTGNYFARVGQVGQWMVKENEGSRMELREDN